jgi:hypothetical protein
VPLLIFPPNPFDGEVYPDPPVTGQNVYRWDNPEQTWRLEGVATGVIPGIYGSSTQIPRFEVDAVGNLVFAENVDIAIATRTSTGVVRIGENIQINVLGTISVNNATTGQKGVVQLVNTTVGDCDPLKALTAYAGCQLQLQIDDLRQRIENLESIGFKTLDDIAPLFDGSRTIFQMTIAGLPFTPTPPENLLILLGAVAQVREVAYNIIGDYIEFSEAPEAGTLFSGITVEF